jgi:heme-degrading monooxygenase HmoA
MHLRITEVTVAPARVDELAEVLSNKTLPMVRELDGWQGVLCAADRATGKSNIVSMWASKEALEASEDPIASIRSETVDALDAELRGVSRAEVVREVRAAPSQVGASVRVVRVSCPTGSTDALVGFYEDEVLPRVQSQAGFVTGRLIRDLEDPTRFAAVSHWADAAAASASEQTSAALRERVPTAVQGASIEGVTTAEIVLIETA